MQRYQYINNLYNSLLGAFCQGAFVLEPTNFCNSLEFFKEFYLSTMNTCLKKCWFQGYLYRFYCININIIESKCDSHVEFLNETKIN